MGAWFSFFFSTPQHPSIHPLSTSTPPLPPLQPQPVPARLVDQVLALSQGRQGPRPVRHLRARAQVSAPQLQALARLLARADSRAQGQSRDRQTVIEEGGGE